ncbi:thiamine phosphate synthase [Hymenobacter sp. BT186]|uniref:Thiamine phosphate synthase n=1 Tax=Hymenobacter telluris TaxID=2816474 RepID=A0A939EWR2_9BACT|nr:thiamine phosphate synthase [Hymenobacter telluris]MBO0358012.1 thiamine phosphate synthase [Hymenobacter telluris]MBW3374039.1 thiamine phosphate synthase [Hymenobacter norwichensis]
MPFALLIVTQPERIAAEPGLLARLFEHGLTVAHLRKPGWSMAEMEGYLHQIPPQYHARLVVHSHYALALRYNLRGIHLTEQSRRHPQTPALLRKLRGRSVSASFHSLTEVAQHRRRYHYVFLSPLFDSTSKAGYRSNFRLEEVQRAIHQWQRRSSYVPQVVALGGVTPANISQVQQAGFAGAAVLGGIWQHPDPVAALRRLQSEIR